MANLSERPEYPDGIYQLETTDPVVGGPDGVSNTQAKQLANRTAWLKRQLGQLAGRIGRLRIQDIAGLVGTLGSKANSRHNHNASDINRGTLSLSRLLTATSYTDRSSNKLVRASALRSLYDWVRGQLGAKADAGTLASGQAAQDERITSLEGNTEKRHVHTITIGGSTDYLYPVFWQFPNNHFGVGRLEISRDYLWNRGVLRGTFGGRPSSDHVAGLLLQIEGNGQGWAGAADYLRLVKYDWKYSQTVSHLRFRGYARAEKIDGAGSRGPSFDGACPAHSGIYLRGGLTYRFSANWPIRLRHLGDEANNPRARVTVHEDQNHNTRWYATPIPFSEREEPVAEFGLAAIAQNGYQRLPNGLILQWGRHRFTGPVTPGTQAPDRATAHLHATVTGQVVFPLRFPVGVFTITANGEDAGTNEGSELSIGIRSRTAAGFAFGANRVTGAAGGAQPAYLNWMALGR